MGFTSLLGLLAEFHIPRLKKYLAFVAIAIYFNDPSIRKIEGVVSRHKHGQLFLNMKVFCFKSLHMLQKWFPG